MSSQHQPKSLWRKPPRWIRTMLFLEMLSTDFEFATKTVGCCSVMAGLICLFFLCPVRLFIFPLAARDYTWKNTDRWIYYRWLAMIYYSMFFIYFLIILICMWIHRKIFNAFVDKIKHCCDEFYVTFLIYSIITFILYSLFCPTALVMLPYCLHSVCFNYVTKYNEFTVDTDKPSI